MPQYYNEIYYREVKVKTRPSHLLRRLFRCLPYYVGQKVYFHIEVEKLPGKESVNLGKFIVMEYLPGMDKPRDTEYLTDTPKFAGHIKNVGIIGAEGNVEYKICSHGYFQEGGYLFTANVINKDRFFHQWFWIIVGAFITLSCTILALLLNLIPLRK